jgi:hypothetical protein
MLYQFPAINPTCLILTDLQSRPVSLVGKITVQATTDRPSPPASISGFNTDNTPFAKGHIMALELGGPDVSENIVPQYERWQGGHDWRNMETRVRDHSIAGSSFGIFIVQLLYGNSTDTRATSYKNFNNSEFLTPWNDYRIPTEYRVWLYDSRTTSGSALNGLFDASVTTILRTTCLQQIASETTNYLNITGIYKQLFGNGGMVPFFPSEDTFDRFTNTHIMPECDRAFWRGKMLQAVIRKHHGELATSYSNSFSLQSVNVDAEGRRASKRGKPGVGTTAVPDPGLLAPWLARQSPTDLKAIVDNSPLPGWTVIEKAALTGHAIQSVQYAL